MFDAKEIDECAVFEKPNIYCHFAQGIGEPKYSSVRNWTNLTKLLEEALNLYNDLVAAMNLVLFEDAMMHICRCFYYNIVDIYFPRDSRFTKLGWLIDKP